MRTPSTNRYKHHRFPTEIINHSVWLYSRFCLGYSDVEELLFARGIIVMTASLVGAGLPARDVAQIRHLAGPHKPPYRRLRFTTGGNHVGSSLMIM